MTDTEIKNSEINDKECSFVLSYLRDNSGECTKHDTCSKIAQKILENIAKGYTYNSVVLDSLISWSIEDNWEKHCIGTNCIAMPLITDAIISLLNFHKPSKKSIDLLVKKSDSADILKIALDKFDDLDYYDMFLHSLSIRGYRDIYVKTYLISILLCKLNKIKFTKKDLELVIKKKLVSVVRSMLKSELKISSDIIIFGVETGSIEIVQLLHQYYFGEILDKFLEIACGTGSYELMHFYLDMKIIPNSKCFSNMLDACDIKSSEDKKTHYYITDSTIRANNKLAELLISFGYIPTYNDIKNAIKYKIKIENIGHITIGCDILYECLVANFFPYGLSTSKPTNYILIEACANKKQSEIEKLINSGFKPNTSCLRAACLRKNNYPTINYLIKNGAEPDYECIQSIIKTFSNEPRNKFISEYNESLNLIIRKYRELNEAYIKSSNDKSANKTRDDELIKPNDDTTKTKTQKIKQKLKPEPEPVPVPVPVQKLEQEPEQEQEQKQKLEPNNNSPVITHTDIKKSIRAKGKLIKSNLSNNQEDLEKQIPIIIPELSDDFDPSNHVEIKQELGKELGIKLLENSRNKVPYTTLRGSLLQYCKKKKLFDITNKSLIKLNLPLSQASGHKVDDLLNFTDIDNYIRNWLIIKQIKITI